ncbi:MAG: S-layer domain-containing protein [Candidatus Peregrinibacteria bacterium Greene0416_19]|nr:MAG: S-layer domain-containing protein [Candidatus Peregrinibacteria bacterium Greene0416_19]
MGLAVSLISLKTIRMQHRTQSTVTLVVLLSTASALSFPFSAPAAEAIPATEQGDIMIEQRSPLSVNGRWTLLTPTQEELQSTDATHTMKAATAGKNTLFVNAPAGTTTTIELFDKGTLVQTLQTPQLSFDTQDTTALYIRISYKLTYFGNVGIGTSPQGIPFELAGPDGARYKGETPTLYERMPVGSYSIRFRPDGCTEPPQKSNTLARDSQIYFTFDFTCDSLKAQPGVEEQKARFVNSELDGQTIVFDDVPQSAWFALPVFRMVKLGILSGYRDENGIRTGKFGPENPVSLAELAKIAHEVSGIDEKDVYWNTTHPSAVGAWYEQYVASAEQRDWMVYTQSGLVLGRPATRGEILVTLLQALDIPLHWPKGKTFKDVTRRTPYAGAIETAAALGIVSGTSDAEGKKTGTFGPLSPINRAEMSTMLSLVIDEHRNALPSSSSSSSRR